MDTDGTGLDGFYATFARAIYFTKSTNALRPSLSSGVNPREVTLCESHGVIFGSTTHAGLWCGPKGPLDLTYKRFYDLFFEILFGGLGATHFGWPKSKVYFPIRPVERVSRTELKWGVRIDAIWRRAKESLAKGRQGKLLPAQPEAFNWTLDARRLLKSWIPEERYCTSRRGRHSWHKPPPHLWPWLLGSVLLPCKSLFSQWAVRI